MRRSAGSVSSLSRAFCSSAKEPPAPVSEPRAARSVASSCVAPWLRTINAPALPSTACVSTPPPVSASVCTACVRPLTSICAPEASATPVCAAAIVTVPPPITLPCTRPLSVGRRTKVPATEITASAPTDRSPVLPMSGALSDRFTWPPGALMRPSTLRPSTADNETLAFGSAIRAEPAAIVNVAWFWMSRKPLVESVRLTGLRPASGSTCTLEAERRSPPVARAAAATRSTTRFFCCSTMLAPVSMAMPCTVFTVMLEKPRSANSEGSKRVVFDGSVPWASAASITARAVLSTSLPPLPVDSPHRSACSQSELNVPM